MLYTTKPRHGYSLQPPNPTCLHSHFLERAHPCVLAAVDQPEVIAAGIPAWISVSCKDGEHLCSGESLSALADLVNAYRAKGAHLLVAIGVNCTPPQYVREVTTLGGAGGEKGGRKGTLM